MADGMSPADPPSRIDRHFDEMKAMFREVNAKFEVVKDEQTRLNSDAASKEMVREVQDAMRNHVEKRNKDQTAHVMDVVDARLGSIRQGIMTDTERLLRDHLNRWMEEKMKPMVKELIDAQEAKAKAERSATLRMWRERAALATAVIVLLWAIFNPFSNANDARESSRIGSAIESLSDIAQ